MEANKIAVRVVCKESGPTVEELLARLLKMLPAQKVEQPQK